MVSLLRDKKIVDQLFQTYPLTEEQTLALGQWEICETPEQLFQLLLSIPALQHCYMKSAYVGEGYSILEHSRLVVERAQHYRDSIAPRISMPWNVFLLFLALHDIGKGIATEYINSSRHSNVFLRKHAELNVTRLIVKQILSLCHLPPNTLKQCLNLLKNDLIGDYLKGNLSVDAVCDELIKGSAHSRLSPDELMTDYILFHQCDAGSYPFLQVRLFRSSTHQLEYVEATQEKINVLRNRFHLVEEGRKLYHAFLEHDVVKDDNPYTLQGEIEKSLNSLNAYILYELGCLRQVKEASLEDKNHFIQISKGLLEILSKANFPEARFSSSINSSLSIGRFSNIRLFHEACKIKFPKEQISHSLLEFTFLHGTNSTLLPNLPLTDYHLLPTGTLQSLSIVPLSGELLSGVQKYGINHMSLSGVNLRLLPILKEKYIKPALGQDELLSCLQKTISELNRWGMRADDLLICSPEDIRFEGERVSILFTKASFMIRQIRILQMSLNCYEDDVLSNLFSQMLMLCNRTQNAFGAYQLTPNYYRHMPETDNPLYGWHDGCYKMNFEQFEYAVKSAKDALSRPIDKNSLPHVEDFDCLEGFPIVLASKTALTSGEHLIEVLSHRPLQLGHDIKDIFVEMQHTERMRAWLIRHHLDHKITVHDMSRLDEMHEQYTDRQEYFHKMLSQKIVAQSASDYNRSCQEMLEKAFASSSFSALTFSKREVRNDEGELGSLYENGKRSSSRLKRQRRG